MTIHASAGNLPVTQRVTHYSQLRALTLLIALVGGILTAATGRAAETQFWTSGSYEDFFAGELTSISLGRDGSLTVAPDMTEVFSTDEAMIWAVARDSRNNFYLGTGHSGKVYRLSPEAGGTLKGELIYDAAEPDIFAIAVDKNNRVYVGTSPDGKIYRLENDGKATEFFDPKAKYIWSMSFAADGALYVGTGGRGRIFRVDASGRGEVYYETNQTHVMTLASNSSGELLAGTEPNGLLYRVTAANRAMVIYDSPLAEIHQLALTADGSIYAATLGASGPARQRQGAPAPVSSGPQLIASTTITVRADDPSPGGGPDSQPDQPQIDGGAQPAPAPRITGVLPRQQGGGQNRSAVVRIWPDGSTQTLWESTSENAFDLIPSPDRLLFSTDESGRIYQLTGEHDLALLTKTDQEQTTRLIPNGDSLLATTANLGKVFKIARQPATTGTFESVVKDAGNIAGWGQIRWKAQLPTGTGVELYTRSGNSDKPDATWSEWSAAYTSANGQQISSPPGRYLQWKAALRTAGGQSPALQAITVAYLPRNRAPEITEIKTTPRANGGQGTGNGARVGQRIVVNAQMSGQPTALRGVDVSWLANDPDQDELAYTLYFRGEAEREWKVLEEDMNQNYFQLNPDALPDGMYRLRVVATDAAENASGAARTDERTSAPFLVDFTAPQIEILGVDRAGTKATVRWRASDSASFLTRAEFSLDGGAPVPAGPQDGIVDSNAETFATVLDNLSNQEHLASFRVTDFAGNVGTGKAVLPQSTATTPAGR